MKPGAQKGSTPWNKGTGKGWTDKRGYRWLRVQENGRSVCRRENRVVMEKHLGRKLEPWELVHHKDENTLNNEISNLEIMTFGDHASHHHDGSRRSYETRRSMEAFALMREELCRVRELNADLLSACQFVVGLLDELDYAHECLNQVDAYRISNRLNDAITKSTGGDK